MAGERVPTTILVAEDHPLFRKGTRQILEAEPDLEVVAEAERGDAVLDLVAETNPDIVLLDIRLPGMSGIDVVKALRRQHPDVKVLIVTAYADEGYVVEALNAGVSGYLLKTSSGDEIVSAVRAVRSGATVIEPGLSRHLLARSSRPAHNIAVQLSPRELEVVRLMADGLHNKEIGRELGISARTVDAHLASVFSKLGVNSRTEVMRVAMQEGLVSLPGRDGR